MVRLAKGQGGEKGRLEWQAWASRLVRVEGSGGIRRLKRLVWDWSRTGGDVGANGQRSDPRSGGLRDRGSQAINGVKGLGEAGNRAGAGLYHGNAGVWWMKRRELAENEMLMCTEAPGWVWKA